MVCGCGTGCGSANGGCFGDYTTVWRSACASRFPLLGVCCADRAHRALQKRMRLVAVAAEECIIFGAWSRLLFYCDSTTLASRKLLRLSLRPYSAVALPVGTHTSKSAARTTSSPAAVPSAEKDFVSRRGGSIADVIRMSWVPRALRLVLCVACHM